MECYFKGLVLVLSNDQKRELCGSDLYLAPTEFYLFLLRMTDQTRDATTR